MAYELEQAVCIETRDVDPGGRGRARDITALMSDGLAIESEAPRYLYTRLSELKIELTAEAARDARARADQIARQSGGRLGPLSRAGAWGCSSERGQPDGDERRGRQRYGVARQGRPRGGGVGARLGVETPGGGLVLSAPWRRPISR